jgi:microcystin-dependent protein
MAQPYIGEIRMFAGNFAPLGWAFCAGQQMSIAENDALFTLIGTTYGGDGQETFNLPDLQGRVPIHQGALGGSGPTFNVGEIAGVESLTLTVQQMPVHSHPIVASNDPGTLPDPGNDVLARSSTPGVFLYTDEAPDVNLNPNAVGPVGGSQPHDNLAPFVCINYIISLFGIFPSPT